MNTVSLVPWLLVGALGGALVTQRCAVAPQPSSDECCSKSCDLDVAGLGLSTQQVDAVKGACAASGKRLRAIETETAELRKRLDLALDAATVDEAAVRQLGRELARLREQRLTASLDCVLGVRRVLSAAQMRQLCSACGCLSTE